MVQSVEILCLMEQEQTGKDAKQIFLDGSTQVGRALLHIMTLYAYKGN